MDEFSYNSEYISYITSEPIHSLGIKQGSEVVLDYLNSELNHMINDMKRNSIRIRWLNSNDEYEVIIIDGWTPKIEDIFNDETLEENI